MTLIYNDCTDSLKEITLSLKADQTSGHKNSAEILLQWLFAFM